MMTDADKMMFPVCLPLRLDWSEMDMFGHINNVSYFKYIQASRVNYWEQIGLTQLHGEMKLGPILASTSCNFLKPLFFPGNIILQASISFIKTTSFGIRHQILNDKSEVAATADDVIVLYDFVKNEKVAMPADLRLKIELLEGRSF
ncbi:MAG: acyl-CoA thioesterase [Sphingobacteriales bacterium]|nr:MAG: acyl-CoA thioesterase [Sphingobacteriales bacterium]